MLTDLYLGMAKNSSSLEHARHNDQALKYMDKKPDYLDWVITMCFYSSLHYVRYKLFPMSVKTDDGKRFVIQTFDKYCHNQRRGESAHKVLNELVERDLPDINYEYSDLYSICRTARYTNYKADRDLSNLAKAHQKLIKTHCEDNGV